MNLSRQRRERGVALVITLVMLALVTLMAITFLAVSRRERSAVTVTEEQNTSRAMADAAAARAKAEAVARMMAQGSPFAVDMMVSTNFISPAGFDSSLPVDAVNVTNVNYDHLLANPNQPQGRYRLRNIANLMVDPRPPVFLINGTNAEFRFYLDLNRNGRFETNGLQLIYGDSGRRIVISNVLQQAMLTGDPEWIGVLQRPEYPHSPTNRFIGRYAYLVLPAGKSLDWNFIHNNAALGDRDPQLQRIGYYRNQGVGSWELNLAAFLHYLNTNSYAWPRYDYRGLQNPNPTEAFFDALQFLKFRYAGDADLLAPAQRWFFSTNGNGVSGTLRRDFVDWYTDGPAVTGIKGPTTDNDRPDRPWPGSDNPNTLVELNDLFNTNKAPVLWSQRLLTAQNQRSTYDRYTFYRMLGQLGMDSVPANEGKINLNYDNLPPYNATNMVPWDPVRFVTAVANRLIAASTYQVVVQQNPTYFRTFLGDRPVRPWISATNIQIYPTNEYSATLHQLLQTAINLYDATTNSARTGYPHVPTVLRPVFGPDRTNAGAVVITGFALVEDAAQFVQQARFYDLAETNTLSRLRSKTEDVNVVYDIPLLVGAKKGWPNFNEMGQLNVAELTRKLELRKQTAGGPVTETNMLYLLTVSNRFGLEAWNSYTQALVRPMRIAARGTFTVGILSAETNRGPLLLVTNRMLVETNFNTWPGGDPLGFKLPVLSSIVVASNMTYDPLTGGLRPTGTNVAFYRNQGFYVPRLNVAITNRFFYALIDTAANRLVDYVAPKFTSRMDLTRDIAQNPALASLAAGAGEPDTWSTNLVGGAVGPLGLTEGILRQVNISLGNVTVSDQIWRSWSQTSAEGRDKDKSIDRLRLFAGLAPLKYTSTRQRQELEAELQGKLALQTGYSPTRKIYQDYSYQVNDPLVHFMRADLSDPEGGFADRFPTNKTRIAMPPTQILTNSNLGLLNRQYRPWGGNPKVSTDPLRQDLRVKDPLIARSDDWDFPTNKFPNIGWIGRVHRGTPWQTVYLKADVVPVTSGSLIDSWAGWAGRQGSHPTNDWAMADIFTTAPNDNAARGLLSVNQTNVAAWAAALAGVPILLPTNQRGGVEELYLEQATNIFSSATGSTDPVNRIAEGINRARLNETNRFPGGLAPPYFDRLGRVLATPELTFASPGTPGANVPLPRSLVALGRDEVMERIPQEILSLLRADEPRFVVYAFGQTLKEAPNSLHLGEGTFNRLCTNYQVKSEFVTKSVIRVDGTLANPRAVVESYNELTSE